MRRTAIALLIPFALAGCAVEQAQKACLAYGYQPDTDLYAACVQTEALAHRQRLMALGASMQGYGAALSAPRSTTHTYIIGGRPVTCSTLGAHTVCQ